MFQTFSNLLANFRFHSMTANRGFFLMAFTLVTVQIVVFPHLLSRSKRKLNSEQRQLLARLVVQIKSDCVYDVARALKFEASPESGKVIFSMTLGPRFQNFFGSLHGGAAASLVDVTTTAAIISIGGFPGVSTSMGLDYVNGAAPGDTIRIEASVKRLGRTLAFTEARLFRPDGKLLCRGYHVKYVSAPALFTVVAAMRPSVLAWLVKTLVSPSLGSSSDVEDTVPLKELGHPYNATTETWTGLPRDEAGKRAYFASFGDQSHPFQGFDASLEGALVLCDNSKGEAHDDNTPVTWTLTVGKQHANFMNKLHGGCSAALVDVLGSALIARGDPRECGVATNLSVQYATAVGVGKTVQFEARMLKRGRRMCFVEVTGRDKAGRMVASGTVTKSLRGPPKK